MDYFDTYIQCFQSFSQKKIDELKEQLKEETKIFLLLKLVNEKNYKNVFKGLILGRLEEEISSELIVCKEAIELFLDPITKRLIRNPIVVQQVELTFDKSSLQQHAKNKDNLLEEDGKRYILFNHKGEEHRLVRPMVVFTPKQFNNDYQKFQENVESALELSVYFFEFIEKLETFDNDKRIIFSTKEKIFELFKIGQKVGFGSGVKFLKLIERFCFAFPQGNEKLFHDSRMRRLRSLRDEKNHEGIIEVFENVDEREKKLLESGVFEFEVKEKLMMNLMFITSYEALKKDGIEDKIFLMVNDLERGGNIKEGLQLLEKFIVKYPKLKQKYVEKKEKNVEKITHLVKEAESEMKRGNLNEVEEKCEKVLEINSRNVEAHRMLKKVHEKKKDPKLLDEIIFLLKNEKLSEKEKKTLLEEGYLLDKTNKVIVDLICSYYVAFGDFESILKYTSVEGIDDITTVNNMMKIRTKGLMTILKELKKFKQYLQKYSKN